MLIKLRQILYRQQPKSTDLMMGIISFLFAWAAYLTRNIQTESPVVAAMERIAPLIFWIILLAIYGVVIILATAFNYVPGIVLGTGLGTFVWGAISGILLTNLPFQPRLLLGVAIYIVFFVFSSWSFMNALEVYRLTKKFGKNYHRVVEEDMIKELIDLRNRVAQATATNDLREAERKLDHHVR